MALLWADGFDHYGTSPLLVLSGNYVYTTNDQSQPLRIGTTPGYIRTGAHYWDASGQVYLNWYGGRLVGGTATILGAGGAFFFAGPPAGDNYCPFMFCTTNKDTFQASIRLGVDGSLSACSAKDGAVFGTSNPGVVAWGAYAYIEAKVICHAVNGSIVIRVNNQIVLAVTGVNTNPVGTGTLTGVMCGTRGSNASAASPICQAISDFIIWDGNGADNTDFRGDCRCRTIYADAVGAEQDWTNHGQPTAPESISLVPAVPATDYIEGTDVGDKSAFGFETIPTNVSAVFGVVMMLQASKTDAGTCEITPSIKSNTDIALGTPFSPGTGNAFYTSIFERDPQGGGNFTYQRINALIGAVERTA